MTEPVTPHPDDVAVDLFAAEMKDKLARKREQGFSGWEDPETCSNGFLSKLLYELVDKGDPVDVGNLAMMIHQRGERIRPKIVSGRVFFEPAPKESAMREGSRLVASYEDEAMLSGAIAAALIHARRQALQEAAEVVKQHDRKGREWVRGSLWDAIANEGAARILALETADPTEIDVDLRHIHVRVPLDHKGGPIPLTLKYTPEGEPNLWADEDGGAVHHSREWAEKSAYMKTDEYRENMRKRTEASRLVKAEVVEGYDGWVTTSGDEDDYFDSVEALLERHGDNLAWADVPDDEIPSKLPAWAFCCTEDGFNFDIEDAIECYLSDNHAEGARDWIQDWDGLYAFWKEWTAKQKDLRSYMIDYKRIVVIDRERYEAELAAARAYLAENPL